MLVEEGDASSREGTSHGLCSECGDNMVFQGGAPLQQYIDALSVPVVILSAEASVLGSNRLAREATGVNQKPGDGCLVGEVFECAYARWPAGCGHTVHCSGCAIRKAIEETALTGVSQWKVPAVLKLTEGFPIDRIAMWITTRKMGGVVLLRIDRAVPPP